MVFKRFGWHSGGFGWFRVVSGGIQKIILLLSQKTSGLLESIRNAMYVHQGFEMRISYGDDKKDQNEELNEGETCVETYVLCK